MKIRKLEKARWLLARVSDGHEWNRGVWIPMRSSCDTLRGVLCVVLAVTLGAVIMSCSPRNGRAGADEGPDWGDLRERMVKLQIESRGVNDPAVLAAMRSVPRSYLYSRFLSSWWTQMASPRRGPVTAYRHMG